MRILKISKEGTMNKITLKAISFGTLIGLSGCNTIQISDVTAAKNKNIPIITKGAFTQPPNYAGGVDVVISYGSTSDDVIKYVTFEVLPYNKVGDIVYSTIGGESKIRLKDTGPINPEQVSNINRWKNVWYNHSISCARLVAIEVTYINGQFVKYDESNIADILTPDSENLCTYESQLPPVNKKN